MRCILVILVSIGFAMAVYSANRGRNERLAEQISIALGSDPAVVYEIRSTGQGNFIAILSPERVKATVLRILQEEK
jgi:hypothetical protein